MTSCKNVQFSSLLCCYVCISGPPDLLGRALCLLFIGWVVGKRRGYLREDLTSSTGSVWQCSGHSPFKHILSDLRDILLFELLIHPLSYLSLDFLGYASPPCPRCIPLKQMACGLVSNHLHHLVIVCYFSSACALTAKALYWMG
jgi:hypothetical protein